MSDRLYLSCRIKGASDLTLLRHFEKILDVFPFSKLARRGPIVRVLVLEASEPPVVEREFELGAGTPELLAVAREFFQTDCSVEIDAGWDLWQFDTEWKLRPAPVTLACMGSRFDDADGDHMRIDFGVDALFLPDEAVEGSVRMSQSNLKSLLHLVGDIERSVPFESRQLLSESGANFAGMLAQTLARLQ
jgi:hypothetical protein